MLHLLTAINTFLFGYCQPFYQSWLCLVWLVWHHQNQPCIRCRRLHLSRQRMELINDIIPNNPCMYGIFPYLYHKNQLNVGKYTTHGWYGNDDMICIIYDYIKIQNKQWLFLFLLIQVGVPAGPNFFGSLLLSSNVYSSTPHVWQACHASTSSFWDGSLAPFGGRWSSK